MKIAITGHSGHIGAQILSGTPESVEFIKLGRSNSDVYWKLGLLPDPARLIGIDAIVHFAWATTNRRSNFHKNIGGTIQLANLAKDLGCPFLFISTIGVGSESLYGKSKLIAEKGVLEGGGQVVRLGLLPTTNRYQGSKQSFFTLFPQFKNLIPVTEFDSFHNFFTAWVNRGYVLDKMGNKIVTLIDDYRKYESFINAKIQIPIPEKIVGIGLRSLRKIDFRVDDLYDGFKTVTTRKNIN